MEKLQQRLKKIEILEFISGDTEKFDVEEFSQKYEELLIEIKEKEVPNKIIFQEKQIELYKSIHNTYYHNKKPCHTLEELRSKQQYVAKLFNDNLSIQLSSEEAKLEKLKSNYSKYKKKTDAMADAVKTLISKYEDANKEYQTQLLNAIKIPLMVYSGRIIQNYPLGLGIRAIVKTNQLVFEAVSKSGSDVYNILSTGQLNGLSIALLLSIKNVYGDAEGLDILLIDDPLQTIDDISAISLADLLTQQGIGQIVLSTQNWDESNVETILLPRLFEDLYQVHTGEQLKKDSGRVSAELYENVMTACLPVTIEELRKNCGYDIESNTYDSGTFFYRGTSPFCEVVDFLDNSDGTLTLYVDAVWPDRNTDCAFKNEIVIKPYSDGTCQYLSNKIQKMELDIPVYEEY